MRMLGTCQAGRFAIAAAALVAWVAVTATLPGWIIAPSTTARAAQALTAKDVVARSHQAIRSVRDVSVRITAESTDAKGRRSRMVMQVAAIVSPALLRLEVLEPAALADQAYVIDPERNEVQVYLPVTNQIVVQSLAAGGTGLKLPESFSPDRLLEMLPSPDDPTLELVGTERSGNITYYVLEAPAGAWESLPGASAGSAPGAGSPLGGFLTPPAGDVSTVRVWIDATTWLAGRIEIYSEASGAPAPGKLVGSVTLSGLRVNAGLEPEALRELPADAEIVRAS